MFPLDREQERVSMRVNIIQYDVVLAAIREDINILSETAPAHIKNKKISDCYSDSQLFTVCPHNLV